MKRFGNIITLVVLVTLLLLNGTSREFIHLFADHQDTIDRVYAHNDKDHHAAFELAHHHCSFLEIGVPVFFFAQHLFHFDKTEKAQAVFSGLIFSVFVQPSGHSADRGPPAL